MRFAFALAAFAALTACDGPAENKLDANASTSRDAAEPAATAQPSSFTRDDLVGRWGAPTERCGYSTTYSADGTFRDHLFDGSTAASGRWELQGEQVTLTYEDGRTVQERIVEWHGDAYVHLMGDPPVRMRRRRCAPL